MIDFDLTQLEDTLYPSNYNSSIEERHRDARASRPMKKSHDLYALSIIIEHFFGHSGQTTYNLLRKPNPDLNTIAQKCWTDTFVRCVIFLLLCCLPHSQNVFGK